MPDNDGFDPDAISDRLREQATADRLRVTLHAHQEMVDEDITMDDVVEVLRGATVIENYPEHKRGPCCLVSGRTVRGRFVHVVCTTSLESAVIITVYEPTPPKWVSASERGEKT